MHDGGYSATPEPLPVSPRSEVEQMQVKNIHKRIIELCCDFLK